MMAKESDGAYFPNPLENAVAKMSMWVIGGGVEFGPDDVEIVLDALSGFRAQHAKLAAALQALYIQYEKCYLEYDVTD